MIDKYKYTTLSYSKNGLSCRSFHRECFYREKTPVHTSFLQFLPSSEAKNVSQMPLEYLSDASRKPPKCPFVEIYKQQNCQFTTDESSHIAVNMWDFKVSKGSVFLMLSRRKPLGIGSELIGMRVKMSYTKMHNSYLQPCFPATLYPYNFVPLRPYTLHLTPYTLRFHFSTSPFSGFRSLQNCLQSSL